MSTFNARSVRPVSHYHLQLCLAYILQDNIQIKKCKV